MKSDMLLKKLTLTAIFMALSCVATMVIRIPTMAGYTNLGDGVVLLGAYFLGPLPGFLAGGVGSMLADLLGGYGYYMPGTFLVKGGLAWIAAMLIRKFCKEAIPNVPGMIGAGLVGECWMVLGYWGYESLILGNRAASLASIPNNVAQGILGVVISIILFRLLIKVPEVRERFQKGYEKHV